MKNLVDVALRLRPYIEKAVQFLDDTDAIEAIVLFPTWRANCSYVKEYKVQYEKNLYKCLQTHDAQTYLTPTTATDLWEKVSLNKIPNWNSNSYQIGDKVQHNGIIWENTISNNIWEPGTYGWVKI